MGNIWGSIGGMVGTHRVKAWNLLGECMGSIGEYMGSIGGIFGVLRVTYGIHRGTYGNP